MNPLGRAERIWQQKVVKAHALLKRHPTEYARMQVQIHDGDKEISNSLTPEEIGTKKRLSNERLEFLLRFLDVRGKAYVPLAVDMPSVDAITTIMQEFARETFWQLSEGVPIEAITPTSQFAKPLPAQEQRDRILMVAKEWSMEARRHLASLGDTPHPTNQPSESATPTLSLAHRLDEAIARLDITHDELARRIGIGKTTYFAVKGGDGKRSTQLKVERYLKKLESSEPI